MVDNEVYVFLRGVFLRTPYYSFEDYDLACIAGVLQQEVFRDALRLASPEFYGVLEQRGFVLEALGAKEKFTLYKYYNRMSFRPTPFGLFASFSMLEWTADGFALLENSERGRLYVLPAIPLARRASPVNGEAGQEVFYLNPTLYRFGSCWRYIRSEPESSGGFAFSLQALAAGRINNQFIRSFQNKSFKGEQLLVFLAKKSGCSRMEALAYVNFLVNDQVLLPLSGTGLLAEGLPDVHEPGRLYRAGLPDMPGYAGVLEDVVTGKGHGIQPRTYYTALERPLRKGGANEAVQQRLMAVLGVLKKLRRPPVPGALERFKAAFKLQFEGRKIPLLEALDPDSGISYGGLHQGVREGGLLGGLPFPETVPAPEQLDWTPVHRLLLAVWLDNPARDKFEPVRLRDADMAGIEPAGEALLPPTLAVMYGLAGDKLVLHHVGGATATALVGRFSLFSEEVYALCRELAVAEQEANPEVCFAELHQLSHLKVDNINRRRRLYDHVISLNAAPVFDGEADIFPSDLVISVAGEELVLESEQLGKRVIPRLPTAYNFRNNDMALFRLLCDLQYQGVQANLDFDPEGLFPGMEFYPRIEYGDAVLSLAKWYVSGEDLALLIIEPLSIGRLHLFRGQKGIARMVSLGYHDQQLVFDLGVDAEALFFLENLKGVKRVLIREYLLPGRQVRGEQGAFSAEFVAFLKRAEPVFRAVYAGGTSRDLGSRRSFPVGSEWTYYKLYCNEQRSDEVLLSVIRPFLRRYRKQIRCWFFIRYHDPEPHLRIRFSSVEADSGLLSAALVSTLNSAANRELIREYRQDAYHRELERYSPELMESVEGFFQAGSDWLLDYLGSGIAGLDDGGELPLLLVYTWCRGFIGEPGGVVAFLARMKVHYFEEFRGEKKMKLALDKKYREMAGRLALLLDDQGSGTFRGGDGIGFLDQEVALLRKAVSSWSKLKQEKLLADLVHMQVNRIYPVAQRRHEGVIYYLLHKYALSRLARTGGT